MESAPLIKQNWHSKSSIKKVAVLIYFYENTSK